VAILAFGTLLGSALEVAAELDATVVNMRFIKPLDEGMITDLARNHELLVTIEENSLAGGAGSAVAEALAHRGRVVPLLQIGLPDRFIEHGTRDEALREAGLDRDSLLRAITAATRQRTLKSSALTAARLPARRGGGATRTAIAQQKALGD
jgi:1-deoxy-D-xylulose-5-phosphate synthase